MSDKFKLIPERLTAAREKLGLNKAETARLINMSKMSYGRYESGERSPSLQTIQALADGLDTSVDYLTGRSSAMLSDRIIIEKNTDPELFDLIKKCRNSDSGTINRLKTYYEKILQSQR